MNIIPSIAGKELLAQALDSAKNRSNERIVKKVRDLIIAKQAFQNAISQIDVILGGLESNDALVYEKIERISKFVQRIKSVVFERDYDAPYMRYEDKDEFDG